MIEFLQYPAIIYPYFYAWIFFGLFVILTTTIYFEEKLRLGYSNILSSLAVSSISIMVLGIYASIIGLITSNILLMIMTIGGIFIAVWYMKG